MPRTARLAILTALGSAGSWLAILMQPGLGWPEWIPLACSTLCTGMSVVLEDSSWLPVWIASAVGTLGGLCLGFAMWWPSDPIAGSWVPFLVPLHTVLAIIVSLGAILWGRSVDVSGKVFRRCAWVALLACASFGPVSLVMTPSLVARRIARNDRLAWERFRSLKLALERTATTSKDPRRLCDGLSLKENYSGPAIRDEEWLRIADPAGFPGIARDGYDLAVHCREENWLSNDRYTLVVRPTRPIGEGSRHFCTDESHKVGCAVEISNSRHQCLSCPN